MIADESGIGGFFDLGLAVCLLGGADGVLAVDPASTARALLPAASAANIRFAKNIRCIIVLAFDPTKPRCFT